MKNQFYPFTMEPSNMKSTTNFTLSVIIGNATINIHVPQKGEITYLVYARYQKCKKTLTKDYSLNRSFSTLRYSVIL